MVSFDATLPGTPVQLWDTAIEAQALAPLTVTAAHLVVIAAHPDDETLGSAGLIALAASRGIPVHVIVVTDGSASHPNSVTHNPAQLAEVRAREVQSAVRLLAPTATVSLLGYPDGRAREFRDQIAADLTELVTAENTLVVAPWTGDGHRDHRIVGELAAALPARVLHYPIWLWHWGTPADVPWDDVRELRIDASLKREAIERHHSQVSRLSDAPGDEVMLDPAFVRNFTTERELYIEPSRLPARYFDELYARHDDPWGFETRWYEQRKRALAMACLPAQRYESTLEIGCSTGLLTVELASRSDVVLAVDVAAAAVERARARVGPTVRVDQCDVTVDFPHGAYDLVVLSEVGYYFTEVVLGSLLDMIDRSLRDGGVLLACHWRHPVDGYLLSGDAVHAIVGARGLHRVASHVEQDFVLEVFSRDSRSVADRTGLL